MWTVTFPLLLLWRGHDQSLILMPCVVFSVVLNFCPVRVLTSDVFPTPPWPTRINLASFRGRRLLKIYSKISLGGLGSLPSITSSHVGPRISLGIPRPGFPCKKRRVRLGNVVKNSGIAVSWFLPRSSSLKSAS